MKGITKMWRKLNLVKLVSISFIVLVLLFVGWLTLPLQMQTKTKVTMTSATLTEADQANQALASDAYGKLPMSFELNQGQTDEQVKFMCRGSGYSVFLNSGEVVTALRKSLVDEKSAKSKPAESHKQETDADAVLGMKFVGGNPQPLVAGVDELLGKVNYLIGNDPTKWNTDIPTYAKVKYTQVYPDIDAVFYGNQKNLEFDFIVAPGADPKVIELAFETADEIEIDDQGNLVFDIAGDKIRLDEPRVYQEIGGNKQPVTGGYVLNPKSKTGDAELPTVGFRVDDYDSTKPLIIDPILVYSTYLGGSGNLSQDSGEAIATDGIGHAFVTGRTSSVDFPTANALQPTRRGLSDVFVTKFFGDGSALVYSTFLGGSESEIGWGITVDTAGNAYLTGNTSSPDFPTLNAAQPTFGGGLDAFITKLNPTGSALVFSTFLGGSSGVENGNQGGIAVDAAANVYVSGITGSTNFPTTPGAFQTTFGGSFTDAFVAKLDATGSSIIYSTFLGGINSEFPGSAIGVDAAGNAYVTGSTTSANFPTTPGAFQPTIGSSGDVYVAKLNPSGSALVYATFLGGQNSDSGIGITVDAQNQAYITGGTSSPNFPTTPGAFQTTFAGGSPDVFVTKLNSSGSALVYSTYIGGTSMLGNGDVGRSIAVDFAGNAHITGVTASANFPTANPFQSFGGGPIDAFVLKLNSTGSALIYSTYLGGNGQDIGNGIALDNAGNAYVTGITDSRNFHVFNAFQPRHGGGQFDAFVAKIADTGIK